MTETARTAESATPALPRCADHFGWVIHRWYVFGVLDSHRPMCTGEIVACQHCGSELDRPARPPIIDLDHLG